MRLPRFGWRRWRPGTLATAVAVLATLGAGTAVAAAHGSHPASAAHRLRTGAHLAAPMPPNLLIGSLGPEGPMSLRTSPRPSVPASTAVAPLRRLYIPDLMVSAPAPLPASVAVAVTRLAGVSAVESTGLGPVRVAGHAASVMAVDPSSFRGWTPLLTARSDPLWQAIAQGAAAASFDMAHGLGLPLGGSVPMLAKHQLAIRIGAFASVGVAGVDAIVSDQQASALGLVQGNALLVSAPKADPVALRTEIAGLLPAADRVQILQQVIVVRDAGEYLTRLQIAEVLKAAASRIGSPYVWGGTGPKVFDCSGLVGWSFEQAGISLPRTAAQQFLAGPHVPYYDARPGDLLFWTYDPTAPNFVDHVALYVGGGMMLVAAHAGTVVSYQPVPLAHMAGVVRVDPAMAAQVGGPRFP